MGLYSSALTMLGVKIPYEHLYKKENKRIRGCTHPLNEGAFCQQCGAPIFVTTPTIDRLFKADVLESHWCFEPYFLDKWPLYQDIEYGKYIIIGVFSSGHVKPSSLKTEDIDTFLNAINKKDELINELKIRNMWRDEYTFELHTICDLS